MLAAGVLLAGLLQGAPAAAEPHATREEAAAMVKKAVAFIRKNGREKAFAAFNDPKGEFVDRELYVSVFDFSGNNLAHGANAKIIGKNLMDYRDPDGKFPIRECLEVAKTRGTGWVEFKFLNPLTKEMQSKVAYVERFEDIGIWVGAYK
jgi:signal transduction histidine kinase